LEGTPPFRFFFFLLFLPFPPEKIEWQGAKEEKKTQGVLPQKPRSALTVSFPSFSLSFVQRQEGAATAARPFDQA